MIRNALNFVTAFAIIFFIFVLAKPGGGFNDFLLMMSAAAAFIFGIFIAFALSNSHDRLNKVNELLKIEDANMLLIYKMSENFGKEANDKVRDLIDAHLIDQIDYRLEDFDHSRKSHHKLYEFLISQQPKGKSQEISLEEIARVLSESSQNRIHIEAIVKQSLSKYEWVSIWALTFVVLATLYQMSNGGLFNAILLTVLASASLLLVLVLRDYDNLKWQKDAWTWKPLHNLFHDLGLVPYYPRRIVEIKEARIPEGDKVRLANYPNPYPDMTDKVVKEEIYGG